MGMNGKAIYCEYGRKWEIEGGPVAYDVRLIGRGPDKEVEAGPWSRGRGEQVRYEIGTL